MDLAAEIQERVRAYLRGTTSLATLENSLGDLGETSSVGQEQPANHLAGRVWRLISEYGYGHRDEESMRAEFLLLLPEGSTLTWEGRVRQLTTTTGAAVSVRAMSISTQVSVFPARV